MGLFNLPPRRENNPARRVGPPSHIFNQIPLSNGGALHPGQATHHVGKVLSNTQDQHGGLIAGFTLHKGPTQMDASGHFPIVPTQPAQGARMMDHDTAMARMSKGIPAAQEYTRRKASETKSEKRASRKAVRRDVDALAKASQKRGK